MTNSPTDISCSHIASWGAGRLLFVFCDVPVVMASSRSVISAIALKSNWQEIKLFRFLTFSFVVKFFTRNRGHVDFTLSKVSLRRRISTFNAIFSNLSSGSILRDDPLHLRQCTGLHVFLCRKYIFQYLVLRSKHYQITFICI